MKKVKGNVFYHVYYHNDILEGSVELKNMQEFNCWLEEQRKRYDDIVIDKMVVEKEVYLKRTLKEKVAEELDLISYKLRKKLERA